MRVTLSSLQVYRLDSLVVWVELVLEQLVLELGVLNLDWGLVASDLE